MQLDLLLQKMSDRQTVKGMSSYKRLNIERTVCHVTGNICHVTGNMSAGSFQPTDAQDGSNM